MALKFNKPFKAFVELQKAFGLKVIEIPDSLQQELKPEFGGNLFVPPSPPKTNLTVPEKINHTPSTSFANNNSIEITPHEPPPLTSDEEEINPKQNVTNKRKKNRNSRPKILTKHNS